jgi:hypothetical protein
LNPPRKLTTFSEKFGNKEKESFSSLPFRVWTGGRRKFLVPNL